MAGTGLSGITSIEEIFLQESQTVAVAAETLQKCGDNADNGDDTTTSDLQADESEAVNLFAIDMDIGETMGALKARAAEAFNLDLHDYSVLVLSEHELADDNTLQKQCGTESGMVQIQFALRNDSANTRGFIDILDVLKPNEVESVPVPKPQLTLSAVPKPVINDPKSMKTSKTMRWIVCPTFKEVQRVLKIPQDPREWSTTHVRQWLSWAIFQFGLRGINISDNCWTKTGKELFALGQTEFQKLVPDDPANMFYMHFELLRRTNVVAVVCDPNSSTPKPAPPKTNASISFMKSETSQGKSSLDKITTKETTGRGESSSSSVSSGTGTQQIQLWQFLLELLTSPKMYQIISWYGDDGEFRLHQPDVVASLWGQRKSKPNMNYEKLSRALRYYYEGDMIAKVYGKRFVYKFVLDLKSVIGYSASELKRQVFELLLKNKLINTEENITSLADLNEVTFI